MKLSQLARRATVFLITVACIFFATATAHTALGAVYKPYHSPVRKEANTKIELLYHYVNAPQFKPTNTILPLPEPEDVQTVEAAYTLAYFYPTEFVTVLSQTIYGARCHFKSWMDWRSITYRNSRQWRIQQIAYTCDIGFRRVDGLYMVALGTYFLHHGVGEVFDITLSSGITFRAVVGDIKSDAHTDPTNRFHMSDGSVVEFIVDRYVMDPYVLRTRGDVSFAGFPGNVVGMVRIPELFISV